MIMPTQRRRPRFAVLLAACLGGALAACGGATSGLRSEMRPEDRLGVAEAAERSGDRDTAASMYSAAAEAAPDNIEVQVRAATGLARSGKWNPARDLLVNRLKAHPKDPELLRALASIYVMVGQSGYAIARFNDVLAGTPADVSAMVGKAVALDLQSRHVEAQEIYHRALALVPGDAVISNDLALSLMMAGRMREAQTVLAPFAESDDVPDRLKINLGIIYAANGDADHAREMLDGRVGDADLQALTNALAHNAPTVVKAP
jgi:Flp pilus assembly protein TadD